MNKLGKAFENLFFPTFKNDSEIKKFRNKGLIFLLSGAGALLICSILIGCVNFELLDLLLAPIMIAAVIITIIGVIKLIKVHNELFRLKKVTCSKCGVRFRFPEDVKYKLLDKTQRSSAKNENIERITEQWVEYNCTCSNCGNKSSFRRASLAKKEQLNLVGAVLSSYDYDVELDISYYFREEQSENSENKLIESAISMLKNSDNQHNSGLLEDCMLLHDKFVKVFFSSSVNLHNTEKQREFLKLTMPDIDYSKTEFGTVNEAFENVWKEFSMVKNIVFETLTRYYKLGLTRNAEAGDMLTPYFTTTYYSLVNNVKDLKYVMITFFQFRKIPLTFEDDTTKMIPIND